MKYAQILHERMQRQGMTKRQLSDLSGVPYMTVSGILKNGAAKAGLHNVLALCRALGIDPNVLLEIGGEHEARDYSWGMPLLRAYERAPECAQQILCKILDMPHIRPEGEK